MDIQSEKTTGQYQPLPGYATSPLVPHGEEPPLSRTLHIENEGKLHSNSIIYDSDHQTRLYTTTLERSKSFSSKPDTTIYRTSDNSVIATLYFHKFSGHIDVNIAGQKIEFNNDKAFSMDHDFRSPALGETLRWKRDGKWFGGGLICLNEREQPLATFETEKGSLRQGRLELGSGIEGPLMDEVVVCAVALAELARRTRDASVTAGLTTS